MPKIFKQVAWNGHDLNPKFINDLSYEELLKLRTDLYEYANMATTRLNFYKMAGSKHSDSK